MNTVLLSLVLVCTVWCSVTLGDEDSVHLAAHVGTSAAINTFVYGFMHKAVGATRLESMVFAGVATMVCGVLYKTMEASEDRRWPANTSTSLTRDLIGIGVSVGTVVMFQF